ncbi:cytochrome-c oxidase, cbb3-type subunit III [Paracoccus marinus]|uniref:cytochrome-c oxidase, cbb3-type subunit III n=1 Tax=Paracoccus marinus TaxID=288426 RepID=UPI00103BF6AB|nr:cytochrome-c oxidase, cbb3-type subunit III [Paracoccus marinus]GLS80643.1 Cbb3-type cytochrome c oxidase subunit [Paracoccus marinus]
MAVRKRDPLTGHQTTGHEWDGITELNTRVPRSIWFFVFVTHLWALIVWILLPTWPLVSTYTRGLLGIDQRDEVQADIVQANAVRSDWASRVEALPVADILADPGLMVPVRDTAHQLFGDNCAGCHGADAAGGPAFPSLVDGDWLWGGDAETVMETLRVGINADHPETRVSQMLAFGRDGILGRDDIRTVVDYVQSLSGTPLSPERTAAGAAIFAENCASCHGADAHGSRDLGAPNLTDDIWLYGGDDASMFTTVHDGRQGWMPTWEHRLTDTERKILAVHLQDLQRGAAP